MIGMEVAIQGQGERQVVHVFIHLEIVAHIEKRVAKRIQASLWIANGKTKVVRNGVNSEYSIMSTALPVYP